MSREPDPHTVRTYIQEHIIDPLRLFRHKVSPLNANPIEGVNDFARLLSGLLTGSDGDLAFQGPAADALADLLSQYLDTEMQLTGSDPSCLQGRLLEAALLCEQHATQLEDRLNSNDYTRMSLNGVLGPLLPRGDGEEGDGTTEGAAELETVNEERLFTKAMEQGPEQEPLHALDQLPAFNPPVSPETSPIPPEPPANELSFIHILQSERVDQPEE